MNEHCGEIGIDLARGYQSRYIIVPAFWAPLSAQELEAIDTVDQSFAGAGR